MSPVPNRGLRVAILVAIAGAGCGPAKPPAGFRVALITPGSVADAAWNAGAFAGLQWIKDSLGVEVSHQESRTPGAQEEALRAYAAQGYDLVFGHGFEFQQPAERVTAEYPKPVIIVTSGERVQGNVAPLVFRIEEGTFLAGMVAGGMTKTGRIGFVGGIELPPIRRGYQGWVNGARRVNPAVETRVAYLNTFDDAAAGKEAALAMIRFGVDMLHHNADEAAKGLFQAAKESPGVFAFGANADQSELAPDRVLGSAIIDLPRAFLAVAREVKGGVFVPKVESFGLAGGVIRFVSNAGLPLPPELEARVAAARDSIVAGTLQPLPPGDR
jgi:basic membrane lipoprotein Med (substrate-binding protein (PBP1-ABC) superfamily)